MTIGVGVEKGGLAVCSVHGRITIRQLSDME